MKKTLALILALAMVLALAACGSQAASTPAETGSSAAESTAEAAATGDAASYLSDAFIDPVGDWAKYDEMVSQIKSETDFAKRTELMHQTEDVLMSNGCVIPIYYYNDIYQQKD